MPWLGIELVTPNQLSHTGQGYGTYFILPYVMVICVFVFSTGFVIFLSIGNVLAVLKLFTVPYISHVFDTCLSSWIQIEKGTCLFQNQIIMLLVQNGNEMGTMFNLWIAIVQLISIIMWTVRKQFGVNSSRTKYYKAESEKLLVIPQPRDPYKHLSKCFARPLFWVHMYCIYFSF